MATVSPTTNLATSTRYAVRSKDIYVNSNSLATGLSLGGSDLETTLGGMYGKIYLVAPTSPKLGDLWYDTESAVLKYCSNPSAATPAEKWTSIFNGSISGTVYHTTSATRAGAEAAAKAELLANQADAKVGDIVLVTITDGTTVSGHESYICVGIAENEPHTASDYSVELMTATKGSEVDYDPNGTAGHYLTGTETVTEALTALANQMYENCDYGRFTATASSAVTGTTFAIPADTGDDCGRPDKDFSEFTGILKFTCCVNCTATASGSVGPYQTFGVITAAVVNGVIQGDSMSLVDYYVNGSGHPTTDEVDVFHLDFAINANNGTLSINVLDTANKTIQADTTITVKAQW